MLATSFTATDEDILGANADYKALEADLQSEISNIETAHPGYDEYRYQLEEINKVPPPGSAVLAVVSPLPERELQTVARDIADSGDGWLRINSRLNRPVRFPDGTLRTALLLGARIATGSRFDPAAIRNAHPGRIRFYRMR